MIKKVIKLALTKMLCALCWHLHKDRPQDCWDELAINYSDVTPLCEDCTHNPSKR